MKSLAVCFLHSYANPAHERRAGEILAKKLPDVRISYEIKTGISVSEEIINYANEWDADTILLLADKPDFMRSLFQQEVLKQVLSGAKQSVHIIKPGVPKQPTVLKKLIS